MPEIKFNPNSHAEIPDECWKDIEGYEGIYQVSNYGRVKNVKKGRWMTLQLIKKSSKETRNKMMCYWRVGLSKNAKHRRFGVHRLVAKAFVENPDNKFVVNHMDGDTLNNHQSNLEWLSNRGNRLHAVTNATGFKGVYKTSSKKNPFAAQIHWKGKRIYLGTFSTGEQAHQAYLDALDKIGESNTKYV